MDQSCKLCNRKVNQKYYLDLSFKYVNLIDDSIFNINDILCRNCFYLFKKLCYLETELQRVKEKISNLLGVDQENFKFNKNISFKNVKCQTDETDIYKIKPRKCKICNTKFKNSILLFKHMEIFHHPDNLFEENLQKNEENSNTTCLTCNIKFKNYDYLKSHFMNFHNVNFEDIPTPIQQNSDNHCKLNSELVEDIEIDEKQYFVTYDEISDVKNDDEISIKENEIESTDFKVDDFLSKDISFPKKRGRKKLPIDFKSIRPLKYECPECPKKWISKAQLRIHRESHDDTRCFSCDVCGKFYKKIQSLKIHQKTHEDIYPFKCKICNKKFTQRGTMKRHMVIHTREAKYQCELCGKKFLHHTSFAQHLITHTGEKPYTCDICTLKLSSSSHLKRHMRAHLGEKNHACDKCGKRFTEKYNLASHQKSNHGDVKKQTKKKLLARQSLLTCEWCFKVFPNSDKLNQHKEKCKDETNWQKQRDQTNEILLHTAALTAMLNTVNNVTNDIENDQSEENKIITVKKVLDLCLNVDTISDVVLSS